MMSPRFSSMQLLTLNFCLVLYLISSPNVLSESSDHFLKCLEKQNQNSISEVYTKENSSYTSTFLFSTQNIRFVSPSMPMPSYIVTPTQEAQLIFAPYGGRMSEISESEIPFPHRAGNIYEIQHLVYWDKEGNEDAQRYINWIRRLYKYITPFVSKNPRAAYLNYRDLDLGVNNEGNTSYEQASAWGIRYFRNNFKRLVLVKTKVDPSNFFRNEQSIPTLST